MLEHGETVAESEAPGCGATPLEGKSAASAVREKAAAEGVQVTHLPPLLKTLSASQEGGREEAQLFQSSLDPRGSVPACASSVRAAGCAPIAVSGRALDSKSCHPPVLYLSVWCTKCTAVSTSTLLLSILFIPVPERHFHHQPF